MGEYDYRVTAMRLGKAGLEVDGSLGMWETTMVVGPRDLVKGVAPLAGLLALVALVSRR